MTELRNKVVLITGAARGIGAQTARALAGQGAKLVLSDIDAEQLAELAAELGDDAAVAVVADVRDLAAVTRVVAAGVTRFGGIDIVLANAGIASYGSVLNTDPVAFQRTMDINVVGVFHTVRAALPSVVERKGYILVVSSLAAFLPSPGLSAYNASKAGAEHFANALRLEVAAHGVAVGSAHMTWIDTPLTQDARADLPSYREMLRLLPWPLGTTGTVDACVGSFVRAMAERRRRVYVPAWVGMVGWTKAVATSGLGIIATRKYVPRLLPQLDTEIAALGRSTSARNTAPTQKSELEK